MPLSRLADAAVLAALAVSVGCAGVNPHVVSKHMKRVELASIEPMVPPPPAPSVEPEPPGDDSAASLLERGFAYFRHDEVKRAGEAFRAAVATGNLNDAGRALAYWHIYLAERGAGDMNASAEALTSFVVVGQDVLDLRDSQRFAVDDGADFVERFDLPRRIARARAILSSIWALEVPAFGRSSKRPVPVRDDTEVAYFLELAPPCQESVDRQVSRRPPSDDRGASTERVTVSCDRHRQGIDYYFQTQR